MWPAPSQQLGGCCGSGLELRCLELLVSEQSVNFSRPALTVQTRSQNPGVCLSTDPRVHV